MADWRTDLKDSAFEFQRVVWPVVRVACGGGELVPVESVTETGFAKQLDTQAGIDAWQIKSSSGLRGIASRIQWDDGRPSFPYCTFTIRKQRSSGAETEYEKRLRAIRERQGWLFPYFTVQAYLTQPKRFGDLLSVCVAKTEDVIDMIARDLCVTNRTDNALFWIVPWVAMRNEGYDIWSYDNRGSVQTFPW